MVIEGAADDWSAMNVFSYDYFKDLYLRTPGSLDDDNIKGQFFSYSSNIMDLKELFNLPVERAEMKIERWYIGWYVDTCTDNLHIHTCIYEYIGS